MKREFLQLAKNGKVDQPFFGDWFLSEKLDGQRAYWDGGLTRGESVSKIEWYNDDRKDENSEVYSTGLWSRYGNVIHAPDWWLDSLPAMALDGELWMGRGAFQDLVSVTRRTVNFDEKGWRDVKFMVFDAPAYSEVFQQGVINNLNYKKVMHPGMVEDFIVKNETNFRNKVIFNKSQSFALRLNFLKIYLDQEDKSKNIKLHKQVKLPYGQVESRLFIEEELERIVATGGEGLMLRDGSSYWQPKRVGTLLKIKNMDDAEGIVIGYKSAEIGKLHGKIGSLIVRFGSVEFELSGFTDAEREIKNDLSFAGSFALTCPGKLFPASYGSVSDLFPLGSIVTFTYRELTKDGLPKEARYLRKRVAE